MKLKHLFLTSALTLGFIIPSCNWGAGSCGDLEPVPDFFNIEGMTVQNYKSENSYDCCQAALQDSAYVEIDNYWMSMDFTVSYFFGQNEERWPSFDLNFMGSALACSPVEPGSNGSQEKIESITVLTLNDFDSTHIAGDTINDLVSIYDFSTRRKLNDFLSSNISFVKQERMFFQLDATPSPDHYFKAKFILQLTNGEKYISETQAVGFY